MNLYDTYDICSAYVCAIEYGDLSGLDHEDEEKQIKEFLGTLPENYTFNWLNDNNFARDEISGLMADCITLEVYTLD